MPPDDLDGPTAAPDHHRVLFENDRVRVLETTIRAGDTTPIHTHLVPHVMYVISGSSFVRRDDTGGTMFDPSADPDWVMPQVLFSEGTSRHTIENTGSDDLVVIGVELRDPPPD
jgi:mannose-6-phosphate isomerase-like protein (cupin superfamily)